MPAAMTPTYENSDRIDDRSKLVLIYSLVSTVDDRKIHSDANHWVN